MQIKREKMVQQMRQHKPTVDHAIDRSLGCKPLPQKKIYNKKAQKLTDRFVPAIQKLEEL